MAGLFRLGALFSRGAANPSPGNRPHGRRWRRRGGFHWRRLLHLARYFRKR